MHDKTTIEFYDLADDKLKSHDIILKFDRPSDDHKHRLEQIMRRMPVYNKDDSATQSKFAWVLRCVPLINNMFSAAHPPDVLGSLEYVLELVWEGIQRDSEDTTRSVAEWDGCFEYIIGFRNREPGRLTIWTRLYPSNHPGGTLYSTEINRPSQNEYVAWIGHA